MNKYVIWRPKWHDNCQMIKVHCQIEDAKWKDPISCHLIFIWPILLLTVFRNLMGKRNYHQVFIVINIFLLISFQECICQHHKTDCRLKGVNLALIPSFLLLWILHCLFFPFWLKISNFIALCYKLTFNHWRMCL